MCPKDPISMGSISACGVVINEQATELADYPRSASTHLKHSASIYSGLNRNSSAKSGDVWSATPRPSRLEGSSPNRVPSFSKTWKALSRTCSSGIVRLYPLLVVEYHLSGPSLFR